MYKNIMDDELLVQNEFKTIFAGAGPQMILCSYSMLHRWEHADLSAPYWRWYWNDASGAVIRTADQSIALEPDRVLLIPPNTAFATRTRATVGHLYCHFTTGSRLSDQYQQPIVRRPSSEELRSIRQFAIQLREGSSPNDWCIVFRMQALLAAALADIPAERWLASPGDSDIARVLAVMHERPSAPLDNDSLSQIAALSTNTLLRRFKRVTGTTPHRYLSRLRAENVAIDLRATDDSIDTIAARHGFCDRFHLSKVFKEMLQTTPAAYRDDRRRQNGDAVIPKS